VRIPFQELDRESGNVFHYGWSCTTGCLDARCKTQCKKMKPKMIKEIPT